MGEALGAVAIIIFGLAVLVTLIVLILKAASFFKRKFGVSLWPGVIALCFSLDIAILSTVASNDLEGQLLTILYIVSGLLLAYVLYRDIRYYKLYSIPAFLLQLLLAIAQILILIFVIAVKIVKSNASYRKEYVRRRASALGVLLDI